MPTHHMGQEALAGGLGHMARNSLKVCLMKMDSLEDEGLQHLPYQGELRNLEQVLVEKVSTDKLVTARHSPWLQP